MKIYLNEYIAPSAYARLTKQFEIVQDLNHPEELDGIIVRRIKITRDIIKKASKLQIISMHGVGLDSIDIKAAQEYGIKITNVPNQNVESVAELAITFMLTLSRKIKVINNGLSNGIFTKFGEPELIGYELYGKKLGLIGSGKIAQKIAAIMKNAFNADVYCYNPRRSKSELEELGYTKIDTIPKLFQITDYINICIPLTENTKNIIEKTAFDTANPNLILVNTSRGGIVNEDDLYEALIKRKIKAAASDVFLKEPPAANTPLLHLDNFIGTFHIGGSTKESLERVSNRAVDNLISGLSSTKISPSKCDKFIVSI